MGCGASSAVKNHPDVLEPQCRYLPRSRKQSVGTPKAVATGSFTTQQADASPKNSGQAVRPVQHISQAAVSLAFLQRFIEDHNIRQRALTSAQVVSEIIQPATSAARCRYTDVMLRDPALAGAVSQGRPFFFTSHTWSRRFCDTADMVDRYFAPEQQRVWRQRDGQQLPPLGPEEVFVWLDVFAINQHEPQGQDNFDLSALREAVSDATATLVVLDGEGSLLTRIWCLYEAWQSTRAGAKKLRLLSYGIHWEQVEKVFLDLDVRRAQATVPADRDRILSDIVRCVGSLDAMTHTLKEALVAGALAQVPPPEADTPAPSAASSAPSAASASSSRSRSGSCSGSGWDADTAVKILTAARLCRLYGRLQQAEQLYRRNLKCSERVLGHDHPDTLSYATNLGSLLESQGRYGEAEPLYRRALADRERVLGHEHPDTLVALNNVAGILESQGKHAEAEPLYRRALEGRRRVLGPDHPDTLRSLNSLGYLCKFLERYAEAEPLYRQAMEGMERLLGPTHPDTLAAVNNLAALYMAHGKLGHAEPLCRRTLESQERVLGPDHPSTLAALKNLAGILESQGKHDEAEPLYRRALEGLEGTLGPAHHDTLLCLSNLAYALNSQGKYEEAEALFWRAMEGMEGVLGADHPDTVAAVDSLAALYESQGEHAKVKKLGKHAAHVRKGRKRSWRKG